VALQVHNVHTTKKTSFDIALLLAAYTQCNGDRLEMLSGICRRL